LQCAGKKVRPPERNSTEFTLHENQPSQIAHLFGKRSANQPNAAVTSAIGDTAAKTIHETVVRTLPRYPKNLTGFPNIRCPFFRRVSRLLDARIAGAARRARFFPRRPSKADAWKARARARGRRRVRAALS
jgi:hypothetical protein